MHPAYQQIIGMGADAVPFILLEMEEHGGYWFWALSAITGQNPTRPNSSYEEAISVMVSMGERATIIGGEPLILKHYFTVPGRKVEAL